MDVKRKICEIRKLEKLFLDISSTNPQHCCLGHFRTSVSTCTSSAKRLPSKWKVLDSVVNRYTRQTLPTINTKYFFLNILCLDSFSTKNTTERTSSTVAILTTETSL
jgi:hypothetical protein